MNLEDTIKAYRALHETLERADAHSPPTPLTEHWRDRTKLLQILANQPATYPAQREQMVSAIRATLLDRARIDEEGLERMLAAIGSVPREAFMPAQIEGFAYLPGSFAIGCEQTISDPHIVAAMLLAADVAPGAHVLDIGTGSGYQAAVLSCLAKSVVSLEIIPALAESAQARLSRLGFGTVCVSLADGSIDIPGDDLFDAIVVAAGSSAIPSLFVRRLKPGGRLVMPVGPSKKSEQLLVLTKTLADGITVHTLGPAQFVPLTGGGERGTQRHRPFACNAAIPFLYGAALT